MKKRTTRIQTRTRSSARGRKTTRLMVKPARVAIAATIGVISAFLIFIIGAKVAKPYILLHSGKKDIAVIQKQFNDDKSKGRMLRKDINYLQTPQGMETEARKLGYIKKGEYAVVFEDKQNPAGAGSSESSVPVAKPKPKGLGDRLRGVFSKEKSKQ